MVQTNILPSRLVAGFIGLLLGLSTPPYDAHLEMGTMGTLEPNSRFLTRGAGISPEEYARVINVAGRQRMLSQKMGKEMMQIRLGVDKTISLQSLDMSSKGFKETLKVLQSGDKDAGVPPPPTKDIIKQLKKVNKQYKKLNSIVQKVLRTKKVTRAQEHMMAKQNLKLLKVMDKAVGMYEEQAKKFAKKKADFDRATVMNLAGAQRMYTQRMSQLFLLIADRAKTDSNKQSLKKSIRRFERVHFGLINGDKGLGLPKTTNKEILAQLAIVQDLWIEFKPLMEFASNPKTTSIPNKKIRAVVHKNLPLLSEMNKAVGMYEAEA